MTPQEGLVLVAAATLVGLVFLPSVRDALTSRAAALLWTLATLASIAALAYMFAGGPRPRPALGAFDGIGDIEPWIAGRPWQAAAGGWTVPGELQGWCFRVEPAPGGGVRVVASANGGEPAVWSGAPRAGTGVGSCQARNRPARRETRRAAKRSLCGL